MSSTEDLLQDCDKSLNTLESGYHSVSNQVDDASQKHEEQASKKKKSQRNLGLENNGFEADDELVNADRKPHKVQVHRTSSENVARETKAKTGQKENKRRHSYAADATKTADDVKQNASITRRRSSSSMDEDLRRKACLNSMRLRRVSSSSQQPTFSEDDVSCEDEVFYQDDFGEGARKSQGFSYERSHETREKHRVYAMDSVCSGVELENLKLDKYSQRLSCALEERAALKEELDTLRRAASVSNLPVYENWKIASKIHFRNEKLNSLRRQNRESEDKNYSFEHVRRMKREQSRTLPCSFSSGEYILFDEAPPVMEEKVKRLPQRKVAENFLQYSEVKGKSERFYKETQPVIEKKVRSLPQRKVVKEFPQYLLKDKGRNETFYKETQPVIEKKVQSSPHRNFTEKSPQYSKGRDRKDGFFLSELEKERRERKVADLAADLWEKLLRGEKFQGDNETTSPAEILYETVEKKNPSKDMKSEKSSHAKPEMSEKAKEDGIAKLATVSSPKTAGSQESQRKRTKETNLVHSESESDEEAFRRNQRRPLRCKRGSNAYESLIGLAKSSTSRFSDTNTDEFQQLQQEEKRGPQLVNPEKSISLQQAQPEKLQSTEIVSQNHSKWFDYMLPPGKRGRNNESTLKLSHDDEFSQRKSTENPPSLQEKLRYYQELQDKRSRDENLFDLADVYMAAKDAEEESELRRQAAGQAAILRREASHLLWQAMDLERICDPNARVRHIYQPY